MLPMMNQSNSAVYEWYHRDRLQMCEQNPVLPKRVSQARVSIQQASTPGLPSLRASVLHFVHDCRG